MGNASHSGRKEITRVRKQFTCLKCGHEADTINWIQQVGRSEHDSGHLHIGCWLATGEPEQKIQGFKNAQN